MDGNRGNGVVEKEKCLWTDHKFIKYQRRKGEEKQRKMSGGKRSNERL